MLGIIPQYIRAVLLFIFLLIFLLACFTETLLTEAWAQAPTVFRIDITNIAKPESDYVREFSPLAQGLWIVHTAKDPLFSEGRPIRPNGLEALAEDGNAALALKALAPQTGIVHLGLFPDTPLPPGQTTSFNISALPGQKLTLAIMLVESNDKFFASAPEGIPLFTRRGRPVSGDFSRHIYLWDAGTEMDEAPGTGLNQPLRQASPNSGATQNTSIHRLSPLSKKIAADGFFWPLPRDHILLLITPSPN